MKELGIHRYRYIFNILHTVKQVKTIKKKYIQNNHNSHKEKTMLRTLKDPLQKGC